MMSLKRALAMALIAGASLGALAADGKDTGWWEQFKGYTHKQKDEAVASGKKLLAETDKKIDEMKAATKNSTGEFKTANEKNLQELQEKKKAAQVELGKLEKSSAEVWDATKTGFSNAAKALGESYDKAVAAAKK